MKRSINIVNQYGVPFNVVVVEQGGSYGRNQCLTHDEVDPLVEFYDDRYHNSEDWLQYGQFVSRYYASTLLEDHEDGHGLCLDGGVDAWVVSASNMIAVKELLEDMGY